MESLRCPHVDQQVQRNEVLSAVQTLLSFAASHQLTPPTTTNIAPVEPTTNTAKSRSSLESSHEAANSDKIVNLQSSREMIMIVLKLIRVQQVLLRKTQRIMPMKKLCSTITLINLPLLYYCYLSLNKAICKMRLLWILYLPLNRQKVMAKEDK